MKQFRQSTFLVLVLVGLAACGAAVPSVTPTVPPTAVPTATSMPQAPPVTLTVTAGTELGRKPDYAITTEVPVLGGTSDAHAARFNADVAALIQAQVASFKQALQDNPPTPITASSYLDQRLGLVSVVGNVVSLKLVTETYVAGAAHPGHVSVSYDYDYSTGQPLSLDGLFLPGSNYLETIASYCKTEIAGRNIAFDASITGADPTAQNYQVWNLTAEGLLITFNEYQVAPYAAGPQTVIVPYAELKGLIAPQGPLATFSP